MKRLSVRPERPGKREDHDRGGLESKETRFLAIQGTKNKGRSTLLAADVYVTQRCGYCGKPGEFLCMPFFFGVEKQSLEELIVCGHSHSQRQYALKSDDLS